MASTRPTAYPPSPAAALGRVDLARARLPALCLLAPLATACAPNFVAVGSAGWYTCGLTNQHRVECWEQGYGLEETNYGQASPPGEKFDQISVGDYQACGLTTHGDLVCWGVADGGDHDHGQTVSEDGPFTEISTGYWETCAIDRSANLQCWGGAGEYWGGADAPPTVGAGTVDPGGPTDHVSVGEDGCATRSTGAVDCWGELDVHAEGPFDEVTASWGGCALSAAGVPSCWGEDNEWAGTLDPPPGLHLSQISTALGAACGVEKHGHHIVCWGQDEYGNDVPLAGTLTGLYTNVATVADSLYCGVLTDGGIVCSGMSEGSFETPNWANPRYPSR